MLSECAVNSREWWESYFAEKWEASDGCGRTRHFMERLLANLPPAELDFLRTTSATVLDWGCAFGDGVELLAQTFPACSVAGLDFSTRAVEEARRRYPLREFLLTGNGDIPRRFDVILSSNCLAYFSDPLQVLAGHLHCCDQLFIGLVPFDEYPLGDHHLAQFREDSFPAVLSGFERIHCQAIEVEPRYWPGQQLLVVYGSESYRAERALRERDWTERQKWDDYYATLSLSDEWPTLQQFNTEFVQAIREIVPQGGRVLEAGCGGGWQSLALARDAGLDVSLMDFSRPALDYARRLFEQQQVNARFILQNASECGASEYDLVFNAGVLEHYTFDEQVKLLRGMSSRSRKYVLVLVPNRLCYWYWLWRVHVASHHEWQYGRESPVIDQDAIFRAAGLRVIGQTYFGSAWTEDFISGLAGLDSRLRDEILTVHRSPIIPSAQKAYLVGTLGCVSEQPECMLSRRWQFSPGEANFDEAVKVGVLADALALHLAAERGLPDPPNETEHASRSMPADSPRQDRALGALEGHTCPRDEMTCTTTRVGSDAAHALGDQKTRIELLRVQWEREIAAARHAKDEAVRTVAAERAQFVALQKQFLAACAESTDKDERVQALTEQMGMLDAQLNDILGSSGWVLLQGAHHLRTHLAPDGSLRHRALRALLWPVIHFLRSLKHGFWLGRTRTMAWVQKHIMPARMSWYAYAFDRFKRNRRAACPADGDGVRVPFREGLISIVLPVYNGDDYLHESIDSILAQTEPNFELIVVDDGSTDRTPEILAAYAAREPRLRVVRQKNQKLPRALSNGFRAAQGEFLTWTSADNRLKPDFLEKMRSCLLRHPHWDMIYANQDIIDETGQPLRASSWYELYQVPPGSEHIHLPVDPSELNTWPNNYVGAAFMYRARALFLLGDYSPWRFGLEDYDYWMRINGLLTLRHSDFLEPVYEYRLHGSSLTSRDKELGITRNRTRMMVFEDFRRDFCLGPLNWWIEGAEQPKAAGIVPVALAELLKQGVAARHHLLLDPGQLHLSELPRLWVPIVYIRVVDNVAQAGSPPGQLPESAMKVLLVSGSSPRGAEMPEEWDVCVAWRQDGPPARLSRPRQGWITAWSIEALLSALDARARSDHLALIESEVESPRVPSLQMSVIICTCRPGERLIHAITSASGQSLPHADYEVIVVNNAPCIEDISAAVTQLRGELFSDRPDQLRLVVCPTPGLSPARNAGMVEARGEILCFLDDDAIAAPNWLEETWKAYASRPDLGVVGGKILLKEPQPKPPWLMPDWWSYWSHFAPEYDRLTTVQGWWEFPWGANWTARRQALLQIGGFRSAYGRCRNDYGGGEELIAGALIRMLGFQIAIAPASQVVHDVEPERFSLYHVRRTIRAAVHVTYQGQRDLHLPMEASLGHSLRRMAGSLFRAVFSTRGGWAERVRKLSYAQAELTLLLRMLGDGLRRGRRPQALSD